MTKEAERIANRIEVLRKLQTEIEQIRAQQEAEQDKELLAALEAWQVQIVHWHNQM